MTTYPRHPRRPSRNEVEAALSTLDFPMDKEELVRCLAFAGAGDGRVADQVRALPLATYSSADEVLRSVEVADELGQ